MTMQWGGPVEKQATANAKAYLTKWVCIACNFEGMHKDWLLTGHLACPKCGRGLVKWETKR